MKTTRLTLCLLTSVLCLLTSGFISARAASATEAGTLLAPTWDWSGGGGKHTPEELRAEIKAFKDMGFERLFAMVSLPGNPAFHAPGTAPTIGSVRRQKIEEQGDDLNAAFAKACRDVGMEVIAVIKPYENGTAFSIPVGGAPKETGFRERDIGGESMFFDSFAAANPDKRVKRRNDHDADDFNLPITKIEAAFNLDPYQTKFTAQGFAASRGDEATSRGEKGKMSKSISSTNAPKPKVHVLVSRDNGVYTPCKGEISYDYKIERRDIRDANGIVIYERRRCNVLTITGLNIGPEYPWVALMFEDSTGMRTIPFSMIRWFSGAKQLKLTATNWVRDPQGLNRKNMPARTNTTDLIFTMTSDGSVLARPREDYSMTEADKIVAGFHNAGFHFNWHGVSNGDGWCNSPVLGLARGKTPCMGGTICEAYPEVRQYWLDAVRRLLDAGFHGVDIRIQNHSNMVTDYMNYGFNEPLVARYKEIHGKDINTIPMTKEAYLRLMKIRGDFFMQFLEDASKLVRERGAFFLIHLKGAYENPICDSDRNQLCDWTMPKISLDWKRCVELADEITIKDYYYKNYEPDLAGKTKNYAASLGKRVWVHCYWDQGDELDENFLREIQKDKRVSGVLFYDIRRSEKVRTALRATLEKFKYQPRASR